MADLLQRLIAVDTENPPGRGREACARLLEAAMADLGFAPEVDEPWVVRGAVGAGETVYFHGHFDVVPRSRARSSSRGARGGRIIGRGSADMKGGLVSMLYGALAARELGLLDKRIVFHFVCDEETGSAVGSGHLRART